MTDVWTPLKLRSANEGIIFEGEASGAGGGSQPVQSSYQGSPVSIDDGGSAVLTFDTLVEGTALLDITDPTNPFFVTAGCYAVTLAVNGDTLTAAGYAAAQFFTDNNPEIGSAYTQQPQFGFAMSGVFLVEAGEHLTTVLDNRDGVSARDFSLTNCIVIKFS